MNRTKSGILALGLLLLIALPASAQLTGGNIYGTVADASGAALPGASLTLSGTGATLTTTSGADGGFRFLNVAPGSYRVSGSLTGFTTMVRDNIVIAVGSSVTLNLALKVASVEETITVTAETPTIDTKKTGTSTVFTQEELSKVPNSRDPWALLRTVPGVVMDRVNVAGNESGQQSNFRAKGASGNDAVWNIDGINITDMAAIGASATYFDYDAFDQIQISTSGNDIRQATGGVGLNFVTKRGTNSFHGTVRGYFTHDKLEATNVPDELLARGITNNTADHNKQIGDYGVDLGGPILKNKLWFWMSYGRQDIRLNRASGNLIDKTLLIDYNAKLNWQASSKDMVSFLFFNGDKQKFGRAPGNAQVEPDSATWNQSNAYTDSPFHGLFKLEDNHVFSPNFFVNAKVAYYNTGFQLAPRGGLDGLSGISARLGRTFGTTQLSKNVRPQKTANADANYFKAGFGGNHEIKFGGGYRWSEALSQAVWPGSKVVAFDNSATDQRARVYREGLGKNQVNYWSAYVGDTFTKDRLTLNLGVRWDNQGGMAVATDVGPSGAFANLVPGISFSGYDAPFTWSDLSPRVGATYALTADRKTQLRAAYARYVTQLSTGEVGFANPSANAGWAEYPWRDLNGDNLAQPGEVTTGGTPLATGGGFNPAAPTSVTSANQLDPGFAAPRTNEGTFGFDREVAKNVAVSLTYTYRKFDRFDSRRRIGMTTADYAPSTVITGTLQDGQAYSVQTYIPNAAKVAAGGSGRVQTNADDYSQTFSGIEFSATKRLSGKWMARVAASWNNHREFYEGTPAAVSDFQLNNYSPGNPTPLDTDPARSGGQVAPRSAGSGSGDVFINGKWALNANFMYQLPGNFEVAANLFGKQGSPFPIYRSVALGLDGSQRVLVSPAVDTFRFEDLWNLDFRLAKNLKFGGSNIVLTADLFNVLNSNTELNRQRNIGSTAFNQLTSNLSPRILRFGMRLGF